MESKLNMMKTKSIKQVLQPSLEWMNNEDTEIVDSFCFLGLINNSKGTNIQEIYCRLHLVK